MPAQRPQPKLRAFNCPNCGNAMQLKGFGTALSAVCPSCLSILDVADERVTILQRVSKKLERFEPKIPLGSRGKFDGQPWEATGFQRRTIVADGTEYSWDEYVLYNPFRGFRYLTEYAGHWNDVLPVQALPVVDTVMGMSAVRYDNRKFKLFQTSTPRVSFVLGEFPWRVKLNDTVRAQDYIDPPYALSSESDSNETTWSQGRYLTGKEVFDAFELKTAPPAPQGVYSNQPNPYGSSKGLWAMLIVFSVLIVVLMAVTSLMSSGATAFQSKYAFVPGSGEPSFVTPTFELKGGERNVEIEVRTDLQNDWMYLGFALINEDTGTAYDFGKEVSYYAGSDSDGAWTEGSKADTVGIGGVPGGRYYLRIEPEMEKLPTTGFLVSKRVNYEVKVRRDVAVVWPYFVVWPFLLIPPIWSILRRAGFEGKRWSEADPTGNSAHSSDEDDDD